VLFSVCDEERCRSLEPTVSDEVAEQLAELIWRHLPGFQDAVQRKVWSCFRTKTPDDLFMIGWDPSIENFFWVAGLGGHGMGASWEIGRQAADSLLDPDRDTDNPFKVNRRIERPTV
jgi:glycine/D-amino acid oxidase-like deaminating enzyme